MTPSRRPLAFTSFLDILSSSGVGSSVEQHSPLCKKTSMHLHIWSFCYCVSQIPCLSDDGRTGRQTIHGNANVLQEERL